MLIVKAQKTESKLLEGVTEIELEDLISNEEYTVLIRWSKVPGEDWFEEYHIDGVHKRGTWLSPRQIQEEDKDWKEKETAIYALFLNLPKNIFN